MPHTPESYDAARPPGLGTPRGPDFLPPPQAPPPPQTPPAPPVAHGPAARASTPTPGTGRLLLAAAVVAAAVGGGAGVAGSRLLAEQPPAPTALPRSTAGPVAAPGSLSAIAAQVLPSVVSIETGSGGGSGFVIDHAGHILTNAHVVEGRAGVTVVFDDGRRIYGTVIGSDEDNDLAVISVDAAGLTPVTLGRSSDVSVGDQVLAIGSPLGLQGTVTAGIVSALDRRVPVGRGGGFTAVQTDASINPGNSGGPLVNARGEVIGVNTAILSRRGGGSIGIGFAIPIDRAADVAEDIIRD
ncbi:S1C family serine protease [Thermostaphylospora chromogena]|uniref:Trypsin-like peptidase domain-containing protein n=1 Tax=Thermostaphylospora chromogena TaxID=35622 RepID=A0A1H1FS11_9ACTN|nr:trypsin-like peptidase domain-containing protein [Thermostaphylospora chromogena]SDR03681.1 Trypsin-like peptidase domain-containing protein [Thermostaphylospora chromogena]